MPSAGAAPSDGLRQLAVSVAVSVAVVVGAAAGQGALLVAVAAAQAMLAYGWYAVLVVPGRVVGAAIVLGAGLAGDVAMVAGDDDPSLGRLAGVLALAALASIVHQLARTDGRHRITASLSATVGASALCVLGAALVAERGAVEGRAVTVVVALAAGGAAIAASVPLAAALAVAARRTAEYLAYDAAHAAAAGPAADSQGRAVDRQARRVATREARRPAGAGMLLGPTLPVVLAAPAAYVLGRLLVG